MTARYLRVRFTDGDRERSVFLRLRAENKRFLSGTEVDKCGDEVEGRDFTERVRLIEKSLILSQREYEIDNHYGWLVPKREGNAK